MCHAAVFKSSMISAEGDAKERSSTSLAKCSCTNTAIIVGHRRNIFNEENFPIYGDPISKGSNIHYMFGSSLQYYSKSVTTKRGQNCPALC